jgi:hypothetical protein
LSCSLFAPIAHSSPQKLLTLHAFYQSVQQALQGRKPDDHRPVIFMVQDEARFGRSTQPRKCWAPAGIRPCTPQQVIREAIYAFAAIAPQLGQMTSLILPSADTDMMTLFLPRDAQRDAHSTEVASQAHSILSLFSGQGSEISLSYENRRTIKDALRPAY